MICNKEWSHKEAVKHFPAMHHESSIWEIYKVFIGSFQQDSILIYSSATYFFIATDFICNLHLWGLIMKCWKYLCNWRSEIHCFSKLTKKCLVEKRKKEDKLNDKIVQKGASFLRCKKTKTNKQTNKKGWRWYTLIWTGYLW